MKYAAGIGGGGWLNARTREKPHPRGHLVCRQPLAQEADRKYCFFTLIAAHASPLPGSIFVLGTNVISSSFHSKGTPRPKQLTFK